MSAGAIAGGIEALRISREMEEEEIKKKLKMVTRWDELSYEAKVGYAFKWLFTKPSRELSLKESLLIWVCLIGAILFSIWFLSRAMIPLVERLMG